MCLFGCLLYITVSWWTCESYLVLYCTILCSTAFCRLSNDSQRRITPRIGVDGAAYRLHGQKLAGIAFNREWNNVGETASAAAAGNRFHSGMVRATNDPWSCAVTAPMARNLKWWFAFVRPSAATIPSSSADTAVLLWVMLYIRLSLLSLRLASKFFQHFACQRRRSPSSSVQRLPAKDGDFRLCDGMCVFYIHMLRTTYVHIAWCAIQLERRNVAHYFGIKQ